MSAVPKPTHSHKSGAYLTAAWIADAVGGRLLRGSPQDSILGVSTDTRSLQGGELFVALRGEQFDAHAFLANTTQAGGLLLEEKGVQKHGLPASASFVVVVDDCGDTLLALGEAYLRDLSPTVIAVSGSAGKTTTKDMISALAGPTGVAATLGNFNNRIGLPLSILSAPADTRLFIAELGINAPGEMDELAAVARPDVALLTHVAEAHLEGLHTYENVLREKMRIFAHLQDQGCTAILPSDLDVQAHEDVLVGQNLRTFGDHGDVSPVAVKWDGSAQVGQVRSDSQKYSIRLPLPGQHNLKNLLAAIAAVEAAGLIPNMQALETLELAAHRSNLIEVDGVRFLDDAYNANPTSMKAALETACAIAEEGHVHAVLGTMFELGERAHEMHLETGKIAGQVGLTSLVGFGSSGQALVDGAQASDSDLQTLVTEDPSVAADFLASQVKRGDVVLVKGSRGARTERIIDAFSTLTSSEGGA
jgi:UDP-N-acetylmuramoyl-tripeptide--D-alanyl-D-alanine ligase